MRASTKKKPVRVALRQTSGSASEPPPASARERGEERGRRRVAGHGDVERRERCARRDVHRGVVHVHVDAARGEHALGVVARAVRLAHGDLDAGEHAGEQHRALHLRARRVARPLDVAQRAAVHAHRQPAVVAVEGHARAHRLERRGDAAHRAARLSDASPTKRAANGCAATTPATRRAVVPLLPQSRSAAGARSAPPPTTMSGASSGTSAPIARSTPAVERTSAESSTPVTRDGPSGRARRG
jgi:hypothetical protein